MAHALDNIFKFYSKQHIQQNLGFEELQEQMNQMDLGEFIAFAKDFSVGLDKRIVAEVFKKVSRSQKPLKDYQFQIAL